MNSAAENLIQPTAPPRQDSPQCPIADHQLLRKISEGSYGEVWLAQNTFGTLRAVKIVHRATFWDSRPFEREFKGIQKFEPLSRAHDGLVDILQVGRTDDYFYYVMELADDASVAADVSRRTSNSETYTPRSLQHDLRTRSRLPVSECIEIGFSLSSALEYLHRNGLVHRDIKPSNIIFVNGVPKLADIGLVAETRDARSYVGTDGFIAPEGPGTPQADLYSLGKLLYEISTGKDRHAFPELPPDFAECPDREPLVELNAVFNKACQAELHRRYKSAEEMLLELAIIQRGDSIRTSRSSQRWARGFNIFVWAALLALAAFFLTTAFVRFFSLGSARAQLGQNPIANKECQEGMYCLSRNTTEGVQKAVAHFKRALELDPGFVMAYNGLFEAHNGPTLGLPEAEMWETLRTLADRMINMAPRLAEAHAAKAWLAFCDWKWSEAESEFKKAIQLNPNCAIAHMRYGFCLVFSGQPDDGLRELRAAELLEPGLPRIKKNIGNAYFVKRDFPQAIRHFQAAVDLEPSYPLAHRLIAAAHQALGDYEKAINEIRTYQVLSNIDPTQAQTRSTEILAAYQREGPRGYWRFLLKEAVKTDNLPSQAQCYANLDDYDSAFRLLETYFATNHFESPEVLFWSPSFDSMRDNPRFIALLRKTGLGK